MPSMRPLLSILWKLLATVVALAVAIEGLAGVDQLLNLRDDLLVFLGVFSAVLIFILGLGVLYLIWRGTIIHASQALRRFTDGF
jgi:hypothetical protein